MNNNAVDTVPTVERMIGGWHWFIRFAAVSVLWAITAWPIVTIPLSAFAANRAWQAGESLVPWRAYWQGFVHGSSSYWVGVPWMIALATSVFEITLSVQTDLRGAMLFSAGIVMLDVVVTLWAIYAWSAMAMGFGAVDALRFGLFGILRRPMGSGGWALAMAVLVGFGMSLPFIIPLAWGGTIAAIGSYGTRGFSHYLLRANT